MCGRFALYSSAAHINYEFSITVGAPLCPRYNISPGQPVPIIKEPGVLDFLQFGMRPAWYKGENLLFNTDIMLLKQYSYYKKLSQKNRCIILANGFYVWQQEHSQKQPWFTKSKKHELVALLGVYDETGFIMLTHKKSAKMQPIMLTAIQALKWLNSKEYKIILENFDNLLIDDLIATKVSLKVNNPKFDSIGCIMPI